MVSMIFGYIQKGAKHEIPNFHVLVTVQYCDSISYGTTGKLSVNNNVYNVNNLDFTLKDIQSVNHNHINIFSQGW